MRKVVGAYRTQLIAQYLSESVLIALFALMLSLVISTISVGWLNDFTDKSLEVDLFSNGLWLYLLTFAGLTGLLAGLYPAYVISAFKPASILKGQQSQSGGKSRLRKALVVSQFAISIALIIATMIT